MNRKVINILLLATLLVLLVGTVNAGNISEDAATTKVTSNKAVQNTAIITNTVETDKTENAIENQQVTKDRKNIKTDTQTVSVSNYNELIKKVTEANDNNDDNYVINLKKGNYNATDSMSYYGNSLTINGNGMTLNGKNMYQLMNLRSGCLTLKNLIISNFTSDEGGAILCDKWSSNVTINNCSFIKNSAEEQGGAIYSGAKISISNSKFIGNKVSDSDLAFKGGALWLRSNSTITNTIFEENDGQVIASYSGRINITKCTFRRNGLKKQNNDVVICSYSGNLNVTSSEFNNNTPLILDLEKSTVKITNTAIRNHVDKSDGTTLIRNEYGEVQLINNIYKNNEKSIYNGDKGNMKIINNTFTNNNRYYLIDNNEDMEVIGNTFTNNIGGKLVYNYQGNMNVSRNIFKNNNAVSIYNDGYKTLRTGVIYDYDHPDAFGNPTEHSVEFYEYGGVINITNNTFEKNNGEAIINSEGISDIILNTFKQNKVNATGQAIINTADAIIKNNVNDKTSIYSRTIYNSGNATITRNTFDDGITMTKSKIIPVNGIIGEKLTLKATVTDSNNNMVNEGNLIFKMNGITIKDNGKLVGSNNPLKVKVVNGIATATVTPDLTMRNANKLTASYIGTVNYNASKSNEVKINISQRNANIVVSSNVKIIKQGQVLTLKAQVYDTTGAKRSTNLVKYADEFVYFKVNGITLKDSNGKMLKVKIVNGTATAKYTVPLGLSGVTDGKSMTAKNHTILAGFYNKNYKENIRNTSSFQVERSNITITISNATINKKTHKLSLTATIKDYLGNIVAGPNKCVIKINGVSLKNGTQPMYYFSTNGILKLKDITIPAYNNYKTIEIVTQDRLAYKSQRNTTSTIKVI